MLAEIDWKIVVTLFSAIIGVYIIIIFYYRWVSKHTSDSDIHPSKALLMHTDLCKQVQKANDTEHQHLSDCIEGQEKRTGARFRELKTDMNVGFTKLEKCIRANGKQG